MKRLRYYIPEFKFHLFDFEFSIDGKWSIILLSVAQVDNINTDSSFFQIGFYQGSFYFDILWLSAFQRMYSNWKDNN